MAMIGMIARPWNFAIVNALNGGENPAFPFANALNNDYGRVWRSNAGDDGGAYGGIIDLQGGYPVDVVAVLWHNMRSTDQVVVRAGNSPADAIAGTLYNGSHAPITGSTGRDQISSWKFLLTLSSLITARYWFIALRPNGSAHPSGYVQASRIFLGQKTTFAIGPQKVQMTGVDLNQKIVTEIGEERSSEDYSQIRPAVSMQLSFVKESEMHQVLGKLILTQGSSRPLLVTNDAAGTYLQDTLVFGRPEKVLAVESDTYDVWDLQCSITSLGP